MARRSNGREMTQQQGVLVGEPPRQQHQHHHQHQKQQQRANTEVLTGTELRKHDDEKQLVGAHRFLEAAEPGGVQDEGLSKETLAPLSPQQQSALSRQAISKLSNRGDRHTEERERVADGQTTTMAPQGQQDLSARGMLLRETSVVHDDDARKPEDPPDTHFFGTERAGHAKKVEIDTGFDTDTSTASDETTSVFWSSGGGGGFATTADSSCGGGALEAVGVIADVAQRPTRAASIPPTCGRHVEPPPPPRSPPPSYEATLLRSSGWQTFSGAKDKRSKASAMFRKSRSTSAVGAKYLKSVAATAAAAALTRRGSARGFSSQHGQKGSRTVEACETMPIDEEAPAVVEGKWSRSGRARVAAGACVSRDGDEDDESGGDWAVQHESRRVGQLHFYPPARSTSCSGGGCGAPVATEPDIVPTPRGGGANTGEMVRRDDDENPPGTGGERGTTGGARENGDKSGSARVRGFGTLEQLPPFLCRGPDDVPHHRGTLSTPEAQEAVEGGHARVLEEAGGAQEPSAKPPRAGRVARFLSLRPSAPEVRPDSLDIGAPSPAQHEKESAPPGQRKGEVGASGDGRGGAPGMPLPPMEVALSADTSRSSEYLRRQYGSMSGEHGRLGEAKGNAGPVFSPVAVDALSRGRYRSVVCATSRSCLRAEPLTRKSEHLKHDQAAASVAAGGVTGARTEGECVAEPSLEETVLSTDGESWFPSPSVWVTRCLDYSSTYGLVFTLSDGSVGLLFNDNAKMVVDPTADTFDYTEAPPSSPATASSPPMPPSSSTSSTSREPRLGTERQERGGNGGSPEDPFLSNSTMPTHQYTVDFFPFYLRKKFEVLRHFRERVLLDDGVRREEGGRESAAATAGQSRQEPLTFIEKWQSVGDTRCLQLSNKAMQVLFSDGTVILFSEDCRSFTVLDTARVTEHRKDTTTERVRRAKDLVVNFLSFLEEGNQASGGGRSLADAP